MMSFNSETPEIVGTDIRKRMLVVASLPFPGHLPPIVIRPELLARLPKLIAEQFEGIEGQHHDRAIFLGDAEIDGDEALPVVTVDASDDDIPLLPGDDNLLGHGDTSPPVDSAASVAAPAPASPGKSEDFAASQQSEAA